MSIGVLVDVINKLKIQGTGEWWNIAELNDKINANEANITQLSTELLTVEQTANNAYNISQETVNLVSDNAEEIQQNKQSIKSLNDATNSLNERVLALENSETVAGLSARVDSLETTVLETADTSNQALETAREANLHLTQLNGDFQTFKNNTTNNFDSLSSEWIELGQRVTTCETNINNFNDAINKFSQSLTTIDTLSKSVEDINSTLLNMQTTLTNLNNRVTALENQHSSTTVDLSTINSNVSSLTTSLGVTNNNITSLRTEFGNIVNIVNILKSEPVVRMTNSIPLDSNGFTRIVLANTSINTNGYFGALNDNVISIVPYDVRFSSSNNEYATLATSWADYENDSSINVRIAPSSGAISNYTFKVLYLSKSDAASVPI